MAFVVVRVNNCAGDGTHLESRYFNDPEKGEEYIQQNLPLGRTTAEEYASMCDDDEEGANNHWMCGAHAKLVEILRDEIAGTEDGDDIVNDIMSRIAQLGGLSQLVN